MSEPGADVALLHALLFVLGFSLVFMLLGRQRHRARPRAQLLPAVAAAHRRRAHHRCSVWSASGVIKVDVLEQERRVQLEQKPVGFLGSVLVGMAFAAGWTPCIGPVLGAILGLAATSTRSVARACCCSAPTRRGWRCRSCSPRVALESFLGWFQRFRRYLPWVMRVSGALLVFVGMLMVTGEFTRLAGWLQRFTPEALRERL